MDCASIDDSWGMDNESFYLCSSNEKSTTTICKGPTANANSIEDYYANDFDQIKVIGKGEIIMIHELGTVGMVCPFPLIEAQKKMATLKSGDELKIDFDCTQATEAIPNWAAENGYPVTNYEQIDNASWTITIQKV